ncbi:MAG: hypothetical protein M1838_005918 [Thelocarpon superellum]|nr:MAG: hypothetical protein M1838_005918 [Thelocarpon superellum]
MAEEFSKDSGVPLNELVRRSSRVRTQRTFFTPGSNANEASEPITGNVGMTDASPLTSSGLSKRVLSEDDSDSSTLGTISTLDPTEYYPVAPRPTVPESSPVPEPDQSAKKRKSSASTAIKVGQKPKRLAHRPAPIEPVMDPRQLCLAQPPVWADNRQELCETLPYYRAYQSAVYMTGGICYGILFDKFGGDRDFMDDEIIISRVCVHLYRHASSLTRDSGGGRQRSVTGAMEQVIDQTDSGALVTALKRNLTSRIPIVALVGKGNQHCPSQPPHRFNVMAWFHVTHIWGEKFNNKTTFQVRYQKVDLSSVSWWAPVGFVPRIDHSDYGCKAPRASCIICKEEHPHVYVETWICLNSRCETFWTTGGESAPAQLTYNEAFLRERIEWDTAINMPYSLKPTLFTPDPDNPKSSVARLARKGMVCPLCNRCNSRDLWSGWRCHNEGCDFFHPLPHVTLSPRAVLDPNLVPYQGHAIPRNEFMSPIQETTRFTANYRIITYTIPECGTITHFMANDTINKRPRGPDSMFKELQEIEFGLQRSPLKNSTVSGTFYTAQFGINFGMPYDYNVAVASRPFVDAPVPLLEAVQRLSWAGASSVEGEGFVPFNELLALGYVESQAIGYHDDGETTLGPTIGTLSLGGAAVMTLRMKGTPYHGVTSAGVYDPTIIPGCRGIEERVELQRAKLQLSDLDFGRKFQDFRAKVKRSATAPVALKMQLMHGDMVVMHGRGIQKHYEHSVASSDMLRFALTCRYVIPDLIPGEDVWKGELPTVPSYQYSGD